MDKETVKIEMTRTEKFEIEVKFPHYRRTESKLYYYACIDKDTIVLVNTSHLEIEMSHLNMAYLFKDAVDIDREEFHEAYKTTLEKIDNLLKI